MMKSHILPFLFAALTLPATLSCERGLKDGEYGFELLTTNDVHGKYFDEPYTGGRAKPSLMSLASVVDSVRQAEGAERVLLVDAGDALQGDNAAYYYNYVDTLTPHLYPRIAARMGYDALVLGNHDIETGHPVYDRLKKDFRRAGIPWLAANARSSKDGSPWFGEYAVCRKGGLKVAVLGYTNPNIAGWLDEHLWSGLRFDDLMDCVQRDVDRVRRKEKPHALVVAVHSGTGQGNGSSLESQGLDLFRTLRGVDFLVCSHDHRPVVFCADSICLINAGSHARNVGQGSFRLRVEKGRVVARRCSARLLPVRPAPVDAELKAAFRKDYEAVKAFTLQEVGTLGADLRTRDAYVGMCDYMNLIHSVSLSGSGAPISFAAPLTFNGFVPAGTLVYNDLFTIYPFENQLFVMKLTGREIRRYLEYSYDQWIRTPSRSNPHVLNMVYGPDPRNAKEGWSFVKRSYNFDSAAGLVYTVDVTRPFGERVRIASLADGSPFSESAFYPVAMTSYRASGGGGLLRHGTGLSPEELAARVTARLPEIRELLYQYLQEQGTLDPARLADPSVIGSWSFVPEQGRRQALRDLELMFPRRR